MREVLLSTASTVSVVLRSLATGDPKAGIVFGDITLYYRKAGGASTAKTVDGTNFREVDAVNLPGFYEIDFTASELDTAGEFIFVIAENGGSDLEQYQETFQVDSVLLDRLKIDLIDFLGRDRPASNIPVSTAQTIAAYLTLNGDPVTGLSGDAITSILFKQGTSTANTINTTLTEINSGTLPGWYTFDLSTADTDTVGDLVINFSAGGFAVSGVVQQTDPGGQTTTEANEVYAESASNVYIQLINGANGALPIISSDGGDNYNVNNVGLAANGYFSVDGDEVSGFIAYAGFDSGTILDYSDDGGDTFNRASDTTFLFLNPTDIAVASDNIAFVSAGGNVLIWDRNVDPSQLNSAYAVGDVGGGTETFEAVAIVDEDIHVAVGQDGGSAFLVRTINQGTSYAAVATGLTNPLNDADFVDGGLTGWVVGDGGEVSKTTDGGASYSAQTSGTIQNLNAVYAQSADVAWIAGDEEILYTTDGGDTWQTDPAIQTILFMSTTNLYGVDGSEGNVWFVGEAGGAPFIMRATAQGAELDPANFRYIVETGADLTSVTTALDEIKGVGFVTGDDSLVEIRTTLDSVDGKVDTIDTNIDDIQGVGFDTNTDSLQALYDVLVEIQGAGFVTGDDSLIAIKTAIDLLSATDLTPVLNAISDLDSDVADLTSDVSDIASDVLRLLGLSQENYRITGQTYDSNNKLTSASIRIFDSKVDADGDTNPIAIYAVTAIYDSQGLLVDYKVTREV